MTWFDWTLIGLWVLSTALIVLEVGKPREPREASSAAINVIVVALLIFGLLYTRGAFR